MFWYYILNMHRHTYIINATFLGWCVLSFRVFLKCTFSSSYQISHHGFGVSFTGNTNLHKGGSGGHRNKIIIGSSVGAAVLLIVTITSCILLPKGKKNTRKRGRIQSSLPIFQSELKKFRWIDIYIFKYIS